jgi:membrane-associated protease RseP (regulator of RpoE activity)
MTRSTSALLAGLLGAVLLAPGAALARPPAPDKSVTVPFELLKSGHVAVMVKVNGKGPYRLIFDTGAPITLVNNKVAKSAGLLKGMPKPAFTLFGSMGEVKIKTLEVGGQKADNVAAVVMDHPTVTLLASKLGPIEGIVGFPFFARYAMTIDYQTKTLTFVPNGHKPPDVMKGMVAALLAPARPKVLAPAAQWGLVAGKAADDEDAGVTIKAVVPGSAAATAGLKEGDRLLTLDGRWTDSLPDLYAATGSVKADREVVVKIKRGDKEIEVKVKPTAGL